MNFQHTGVSTFASRTSPNTDQSLQKSLHLSNADKIELKKISTLSENTKYATAQPNDRQKSVAMQTPKPLPVKRFNYSLDRRQLATGVWQKWRFSSPQTHLRLIRVWFSASTFVLKIATFAKLQTVVCLESPLF